MNRGLPEPYLQKYFRRSGREWEVCDRVRKMISFEQFDLRDSPARFGVFDAVLCRNVLIYFEKKDVEYVVKKMRDNLKRGGYLFLGHSESAAGTVPGLKRVGPAVFMKE